MFKNTLISILGMALSAQASIALDQPVEKHTIALHCHDFSTPKHDDLTISISEKMIRELRMGRYSLIKDGKLLNDSDIGQDVSGVYVGPVERNDNGLLSIEVRLTDYSDILSYNISIAEDSGEAAIISTLKSSDGDGQLHVNSDNPICNKTDI